MGNPQDPTQPPQPQPGSYGQQLPPYDPGAPLPPQQPGYQYPPPPPYGQQQPGPYYGQQYGKPPVSGTQTMSIIAFVMAAIALLILPPIFGAIGIALGVIGHRRGEKLGSAAAITSGVCLVLGMIFSYMVNVM
ncbi:hypothetical protein GCM10009555_006440 [Acrocarpospora macrocephala]|uniref:DUF4190 domain-containing protein n=1 Tax=Acrocarpospora macrocephala TaxID=150177 RepID=A0A5M3X1N5_9ACTN|nr:hypothetical protein [Acrocarpospora macrocephala]GES15637.1 hypothetical protein Amac_092350 [Acrocarpospora macrocephala]